MRDDEIDAILRENALVRVKRPPSSGLEAEAHTPLVAMRKKLGVVWREPDADDDLALVLVQPEAEPSRRPRAVLLSRKHRKVIGERG
jgi:hypothetical protein